MGTSVPGTVVVWNSVSTEAMAMVVVRQRHGGGNALEAMDALVARMSEVVQWRWHVGGDGHGGCTVQQQSHNVSGGRKGSVTIPSKQQHSRTRHYGSQSNVGIHFNRKGKLCWMKKCLLPTTQRPSGKFMKSNHEFSKSRAQYVQESGTILVLHI